MHRRFLGSSFCRALRLHLRRNFRRQLRTRHGANCPPEWVQFFGIFDCSGQGGCFPTTPFRCFIRKQCSVCGRASGQRLSMAGIGRLMSQKTICNRCFGWSVFCVPVRTTCGTSRGPRVSSVYRLQESSQWIRRERQWHMCSSGGRTAYCTTSENVRRRLKKRSNKVKASFGRLCGQRNHSMALLDAGSVRPRRWSSSAVMLMERVRRSERATAAVRFFANA
mmetsp:Transcript_54232/g.166860  ORF Transcript_54232/g.166860 Transcript_54232/m.166860 type:complete len:222 (+) Transcript_54232:805-1470(+)